MNQKDFNSLVEMLKLVQSNPADMIQMAMEDGMRKLCKGTAALIVELCKAKHAMEPGDIEEETAAVSADLIEDFKETLPIFVAGMLHGEELMQQGTDPLTAHQSFTDYVKNALIERSRKRATAAVTKAPTTNEVGHG